MRKFGISIWIVVKNLPRLLFLLVLALRDSRVSSQTKSKILTSSLYLFSPIDLIPEMLFGNFGFTDDSALFIVLFNELLNEEPAQVVEELWTGSLEDLKQLRDVFSRWAGFINHYIRPAASRVVSTVLLGGRS